MPGHERADRVEHRRAAQQRWTVGLAHDRHEPAHRLHQHVHAGLVPPRPIRSERGERAVHEPGIDPSQARPVDAEALGDAAPIGLDDDVGEGHQAVEGREPLGPGEVERHTPLVPVDRDEDGALVAQLGPVGGAGGVAAGRLLDLHDVGPHVGQVHPAGGPGDQMGQLEHAVSAEGQGRHRGTLIARHCSPSASGVPRIVVLPFWRRDSR